MMIEMRDTEKSFGARRVLAGLDLSVQEGEVYGLLGNNGAGKSTTINILTGLIGSDAGEVSVAGRPPSAEIRTLIGVAPQEIALYQHLTCKENLRFFGGIHRLRGSTLKQHVDRVVDTLDLSEYGDARVSTMSGGWQRRVNLAVAIVHAPAIVILDEPTAGLDVQARYELWEFVRTLRRDGTTVLLTTHMMDEAESLCDRVGILHDGRILREGSIDALCRVIPAAELAEVDVEDIALLLCRAGALGIPVRRYGGRTTLLLPAKTTLADLIGQFEGVPLRSVTLRPVGIQQVFLELTQPNRVSEGVGSGSCE
ncbi:MAG: ABC transporter ATP-binding protein [Gemmatimonadales bacterium]|nr:ABC transporter ATP-binding protein [Gemmatimonadales bacterium]